MKIRIPGFDTDTRGNRLLSWATRRVGGQTELHLCAPSKKIARQVELCLPETASVRSLTEDDFQHDWTHVWVFEGDLPTVAGEMIGVLMDVLTLEHPSGVLSIALDFYKDPEETEAGTFWRDTPAGAMVNRAKYWSSGVERNEAMDEMAARLSDVIKRHPILRKVNAIISVPGSDTTEWRPGETVAFRTAELVAIPFVRTTAAHQQRPEAKADGERADLSNEFEVALPPGTRSVLIVDDVLKSGASMSAVVLAAKRAGAQFAYGLVCARTRRKG